MLAHLGPLQLALVYIPKSTPIVESDVIECFPVGYKSDFEYPWYGIFLQYEVHPCTRWAGKRHYCVFFRPRRFGKSLTISMLEKFHDVKYKQDYWLLFSVWTTLFLLPRFVRVITRVGSRHLTNRLLRARSTLANTFFSVSVFRSNARSRTRRF